MGFIEFFNYFMLSTILLDVIGLTIKFIVYIIENK